MHRLIGAQPVAACSDNPLGGMWFAFIAIFLVVLFVLFRRNDGERHHTPALEAVLPALLPAVMAGKRCHGGGDIDEWKITELLRDQARDTGKITHDVDIQAAKLQHGMDMQHSAIKESIGHVIEHQGKCALDAERQANARYIDEKNEKMAELRLALAEKEAKILHQETLTAIGRSNCELNSKFEHVLSHVQHELTVIKDKMLKAPAFFPYGGTQAVNLCPAP